MIEPAVWILPACRIRQTVQQRTCLKAEGRLGFLHAGAFDALAECSGSQIGELDEVARLSEGRLSQMVAVDERDLRPPEFKLVILSHAPLGMPREHVVVLHVAAVVKYVIDDGLPPGGGCLHRIRDGHAKGSRVELGLLCLAVDSEPRLVNRPGIDPEKIEVEGSLPAEEHMVQPRLAEPTLLSSL